MAYICYVRASFTQMYSGITNATVTANGNNNKNDFDNND